MIELCTNGEKTLERFRYQFPEDWLYSEQLIGEWGAYNDILKRKNDSIQEQLGMGFSSTRNGIMAYGLVVQRASRSR